MVEDRDYDNLDYNYDNDFYGIPDKEFHLPVSEEMKKLAGVWLGR